MARIGELRRTFFIGLMMGMATGAIITALSISTTKVEAQSPIRFQPQSTELVNGEYIRAICDTATGTLLFDTHSGGIWGLPNGCTKNPK